MFFIIVWRPLFTVLIESPWSEGEASVMSEDLATYAGLFPFQNGMTL